VTLSDNWDFYFCSIDEKLASVFLDLGIADSAPLKDYQDLAYVRVFMNQPREDGLSSNDETDSLNALEDQLENKLTADDASVYVGRSTSDGERDFFFYTSDVTSWSSEVAEAMGEFPAYRFEQGGRNDEDWSLFFDFLFPSEMNWQVIQNRRVCEDLENKGDSFNDQREIDHWAYFPDEVSLKEFETKVLDLGFKLCGYTGAEEDQREFGIHISKVDLPSYETIDDITLPLFDLAKELGGEYDGWTTTVVT
jgi:regulator of RNase E activity RraB|tara:strand:- start:2076 stop:2828 length:753 start_codon:yes stop_codon:yes gene_type:complete